MARARPASLVVFLGLLGCRPSLDPPPPITPIFVAAVAAPPAEAVSRDEDAYAARLLTARQVATSARVHPMPTYEEPMRGDHWLGFVVTYGRDWYEAVRTTVDRAVVTFAEAAALSPTEGGRADAFAEAASVDVELVERIAILGRSARPTQWQASDQESLSVLFDALAAQLEPHAKRARQMIDRCEQLDRERCANVRARLVAVGLDEPTYAAVRLAAAVLTSCPCPARGPVCGCPWFPRTAPTAAPSTPPPPRASACPCQPGDPLCACP